MHPNLPYFIIFMCLLITLVYFLDREYFIPTIAGAIAILVFGVGYYLKWEESGFSSFLIAS